MSRTPKALVYWTVLPAWLLLDVLTKRLALAYLVPGHPVEVLGDVVRLRLGFNTGAAMGISLGDWSRPVFTLIGIVLLVVLVVLYRRGEPRDRLRALLLALITAGALGNLADRLRWSLGVVDFIDIGIGSTRFWTFNVADAGITVGAIALALTLESGSRKSPTRAAENQSA